MDDPVGVGGATIDSISVNAIVNGSDYIGYYEDITLTYSLTGEWYNLSDWDWIDWFWDESGYDAGGISSFGVWDQVTIPLITTKPGGGPLDLTDVNNLQIQGEGFIEYAGGPSPHSEWGDFTITEVYAEIEYTLP